MSEKTTTSTKAWNGSITAGVVSGGLSLLERLLMVDFPPEVEVAAVALVTAIATWWMVWLFPNKEVES